MEKFDVNFLEKSAPKTFIWQTATYPNEKHNSVRLKGIYDGIKFRNADKE